MIPAVRRDFMPRARDCADQVALPVRQPAEHEERRARFVPIQEIEQLGDLPHHPGLEPPPLGPRHAGLERRDLEVLLEVDREVVSDHGPQRCNVCAC